jgi:asparagine synthase (glutamine-hydrolysing)
MCGISGLFNCGDRETLARMTSVQSHRGPDDVGLWERRFPDGGYVGLGSRRLSIIDLSPSGHMPMCNADRTLWITYNGEIYNFENLRHQLQNRGHRFVSGTDTEVVLHLYEEKGAECVKRLNGMFAFAICDLRSAKPELFLARDHFGVKPFYYGHFGRRFAFASEIKALLEVPGIEAELDPESLHQYLTFLWVPEPRTMFRGIHKLPAGHHATIREGQLRITKYWDLPFPAADAAYPRCEAEMAEAIRERFRRSVEAQMIGHVPIGAFLSAGLDSSSIVAMLAGSMRQPLRTYTITFPPRHRVGENALDNPEVPARLARRLGVDNQQIIVEPDVAALLPRLIWHMDEPVADPAIIAAYLVCHEARKQSTVLLSGVGGDELFAGYRKHSAHYWAQAYQKIAFPWRRRIDASLTSLPTLRGTHAKGLVRLVKKMARSASLPPAEQFLANCTYLDAEQKEALYTPALHDQVRNFDPAVQHCASFEKVRDADFLNQMLYLDTKIFMPSLNLNYNDKMSMASSVELRVPFLDRELAEFVAWNVPPKLKLKGFLRPTTKHIFREAMRDVLPDEVLKQPKAGFAAPVDYWLSHDLREMVDDLLSESRVRQRGLFRHEAVSAYVHEHRRGKHDWSMQVWQFLTLELWMQAFLDGRAKHTVADGIDIPRMAIA